MRSTPLLIVMWLLGCGPGEVPADPTVDPDPDPTPGETTSCLDGLVSTGDAVGDVAADFVLLDADGQPVSLHSLCEQPVWVVTQVMWHPACRDQAAGFQAELDALSDLGVVGLTLLAENVESSEADADDLDLWATTYGLAHAVVADPDWTVTSRFVPDSFAVPTMQLFGPGAEVLATDAFLSEHDVRELLQP